MEVKTVQYAVERGIGVAEILAVGLPEDQSVEDAVGLAQRGLDELRQLVTTASDLMEVE